MQVPGSEPTSWHSHLPVLSFNDSMAHFTRINKNAKDPGPLQTKLLHLEDWLSSKEQLLLLKRKRVWFQALTWASLQTNIISAPWVLMMSSGLCGQLHWKIHVVYTEIYVLRNDCEGPGIQHGQQARGIGIESQKPIEKGGTEAYTRNPRPRNTKTRLGYLWVSAGIRQDSFFKPHPTHALTCARTPWNIYIHQTDKRKKWPFMRSIIKGF